MKILDYFFYKLARAIFISLHTSNDKEWISISQRHLMSGCCLLALPISSFALTAGVHIGVQIWPTGVIILIISTLLPIALFNKRYDRKRYYALEEKYKVVAIPDKDYKRKEIFIPLIIWFFAHLLSILLGEMTAKYIINPLI